MPIKKFIFSFLLLISQGRLLAKPYESDFSVSVSIHKVAQNPWEAKEQALAVAAQEGIPLLAEKLCFSADYQRCLEALSAEAEVILSSLQVEEQVFFNNSAFKAKVLCHYHPQKVKAILAKHRLPFTTQRGDNVLLVIDVTKSQLDQTMLQEAWMAQSTHFVRFHTGFCGLQERALWSQYSKTHDAEPVISYYAGEYPEQPLIWIRYTDDECGRNKAAFFLAKEGVFEFIFECDAVSEDHLEALVKRHATEFIDWWKSQSFVKPWEVSISLKCKDLHKEEDWFAFKAEIDKTFPASHKAMFSLSKTKGCVAVEVLQTYTHDKVTDS